MFDNDRGTTLRVLKGERCQLGNLEKMAQNGRASHLSPSSSQHHQVIVNISLTAQRSQCRDRLLPRENSMASGSLSLSFAARMTALDLPPAIVIKLRIEKKR